MVFAGFKIALCGRFKGYTHDSLTNLIQTHNGSITSLGDPETTHIITTETDYSKPHGKVPSFLREQADAGDAGKVKCLKLEWVLESIEKGVAADEKEYIFRPPVALDAVVDGARKKRGREVNGRENGEAENGERLTKRGRAGRAQGRATEAAKDTEEAGEVEKPAKKARGRAGKAETTAAKDAGAEPEAKPMRGGGREKKRDAEEAVKKEAVKEKPSKGSTKPASKAEEKKSTTAEKKPKRAIQVPVDEVCGARSTHHVYIDDSDGVLYDATLNQTNIGANNNKFYYIQLLEHNSAAEGNYAVWTHWGRVGESGQNNLTQNLKLDAAKVLFCKKFKDKSGLAWEKRRDRPKSGKYTLIEKNYGEEEEDVVPDAAKAKSNGSGGPKEKREPLKSTLSPELQDLVRFIFNTKNMKTSMTSLNYNFDKLPLGKLSKRTIEQGYLALKELGEVIADPKLARSKYKDSLGNVYDDLTSRYYTVIPHDFGRNRPVVINSEEALKREITLVETLGNMEIANEIIKDSGAGEEEEGVVDEDGRVMNPLDKQFRSLGLEEAVPLDNKSQEFQHLEGYFKHSKREGVSSNAQIEQIYRISRAAEKIRFDEEFSADALAKKDATAKVGDGRKLLWHGSRGGNFGGILSQGLRIAPPEAPVNGYAFGKGIYLADRACKSAAYCDPWTSDNAGLLLLCEAQLGDPPYLKKHHEYGARESAKKQGLLSTKYLEHPANEPTEWMDAGEVLEEFEGAELPDHRVPLPYSVGNPNEYIVYDVAQVKLKYVFKLRWTGRVGWGIG